jgi:hypothetical protein
VGYRDEAQRIAANIAKLSELHTSGQMYSKKQKRLVQ